MGEGGEGCEKPASAPPASQFVVNPSLACGGGFKGGRGGVYILISAVRRPGWRRVSASPAPRWQNTKLQGFHLPPLVPLGLISGQRPGLVLRPTRPGFNCGAGGEARGAPRSLSVAKRGFNPEIS